MPGLLRGMARTAVVVGVAGNVQHRQQQRWAQQDYEQQQQQAMQAEPVQEPTDTNQQFAELEKLAQLRDNGILTQEEFDTKKKQILGL